MCSNHLATCPQTFSRRALDQLTENPRVGGSNPPLGTIGLKDFRELAYPGVVTLSQTERNLPTTANIDARDFRDLA
jgi:hypothetical protein